jgi:hypothetical protein
MDNAMTEESENMNCHECGAEKTVLQLSPAVIDGTLKLVCKQCWADAVETGRATIFTREDLTMFSELKNTNNENTSGQSKMTARKVAMRLKALIESAASEEIQDFEAAKVEPMLSTVRRDDGIFSLKLPGGRFLITIEELPAEITEDPHARPKDVLDSDVVG